MSRFPTTCERDGDPLTGPVAQALSCDIRTTATNPRATGRRLTGLASRVFPALGGTTLGDIDCRLQLVSPMPATTKAARPKRDAPSTGVSIVRCRETRICYLTHTLLAHEQWREVAELRLDISQQFPRFRAGASGFGRFRNLSPRPLRILPGALGQQRHTRFHGSSIGTVGGAVADAADNALADPGQAEHVVGEEPVQMLQT